MRKRFHSDVMLLAAKALRNGAKWVGPTTLDWDISSNCSDPYRTAVMARPSPKPGHDKWIVVKQGKRAPLEVILWTPCRKCDTCKRKRQYMWKQRIHYEFGLSARTWQGTLTLAPTEHYRVLAACSARLRERGTSFDKLPPQEQMQERHEFIGREITLMLKRIREDTGAPFTYLVVAELHKSGNPHYHLLVHEKDAAKPIRHAQLAKQWKLGFVNWKLKASASDAEYVAKYLNKSAGTGLARQRASLGYGQHPQEGGA